MFLQTVFKGSTAMLIAFHEAGIHFEDHPKSDSYTNLIVVVLKLSQGMLHGSLLVGKIFLTPSNSFM